MKKEEMIELLKNEDWTRAFCKMPPEYQEVYRKVGKKNCLFLNEAERWIQSYESDFQKNMTYKIKSDYQPKPEIVCNKVFLEFETFRAVLFETGYKVMCPGQGLQYIDAACRCKGFAGFYDSDGDYCNTDDIATRIEVHSDTIIAKFRK